MAQPTFAGLNSPADSPDLTRSGSSTAPGGYTAFLHALRTGTIAPIRESWTEEEVLDYLCAVVNRSPQGSGLYGYEYTEIATRRYGAGNYPSLNTVEATFGNWTSALTAAGYGDRGLRGYYSEELYVAALQEVARSLGVSAYSTGDYARYTSRTTRVRRFPTYHSLLAHFGTWRAAMTAAGLATVRVGQEGYGRDECALALGRVAAALNVWTLTLDQYNRAIPAADAVAYPEAHTILRAYGTWNTALLAAGLDPSRKTGRSRGGYSREDCVLALKTMAVRLGVDQLAYYAYTENLHPTEDVDLPSGMTIRRVCGSWTAATEAAGLRVNRARRAS